MITYNENTKFVQRFMKNLKRNDGYCPCKAVKTEDNKCPCKEFRDFANKPDSEGFCNCKLYYKGKD